ncbi:MAG: hypothetical protein IPJ18_10635 [Betaproteobacteria bacterium]|nr:hypothetical protein [Betaproteobacteria bacterium]
MTRATKIERSGTFDTRAMAEKWVKEEEDAIDKMLTVQGGFTVGFETITVRVVLKSSTTSTLPTKRRTTRRNTGSNT